ELSILMSLERLYKEKPQSGYTVDRSARCHLALSQQVSLITSQLIGSKPIWRLAKMASERSYVLQVFATCDLGIEASGRNRENSVPLRVPHLDRIYEIQMIQTKTSFALDQ